MTLLFFASMLVRNGAIVQRSSSSNKILKEKLERLWIAQKKSDVPKCYKVCLYDAAGYTILGKILIAFGILIFVGMEYSSFSGEGPVTVGTYVVISVLILLGIILYRVPCCYEIIVKGENLCMKKFVGFEEKITFQDVSKIVLDPNNKIRIYIWENGHQKEKKMAVVDSSRINMGWFETTLKRAIVKYEIKCERTIK